MIKHIVMWQFKQGEEENVKKFLDGLMKLKDIIPQLVSVETGVNINPDNKFDAVLITEFRNMEDLETYKNHPEHIKVSDLCKSINRTPSNRLRILIHILY